MTLTIIEANGPATAEDVERAEENLGVALPRQYRKFLTSVGGGQTNDLDVQATDGDGVLNEIAGTDDLLKLNVNPGRAGFSANVPKRYLLIGYGSGGAPCLRISDGDEESVWWADFEKAGGIVDEDSHEEIMIRLADDFDSFLALFD